MARVKSKTDVGPTFIKKEAIKRPGVHSKNTRPAKAYRGQGK